MADLARVRRAAEMLSTVHYLLTVRKLDSENAADRRTSETYLQVRRIAGEAQGAIEEEIEPLVALVTELRGWFDNEVAAGDEALSLWVEKIDAVLPREPVKGPTS